MGRLHGWWRQLCVCVGGEPGPVNFQSVRKLKGVLSSCCRAGMLVALDSTEVRLIRLCGAASRPLGSAMGWFCSCKDSSIKSRPNARGSSCHGAVLVSHTGHLPVVPVCVTRFSVLAPSCSIADRLHPAQRSNVLTSLLLILDIAEHTRGPGRSM